MRTGVVPALRGLIFPRRGYPCVELVYQYLPFDRTCEQWLGIKVEEGWISEIEEKLRIFQTFWDAEAPSLLGTTVSETGITFRRRELVATLSLCTTISMSTPLILGVGRFLDGPTRGNPLPMHQFSALLYHELLHGYLPFPMPGSRMMEKYRREPAMVLTHLHLMALQKQVYLKLGRHDQLREIVDRESAAENPIYRRSWEIVNQAEGHEVFVGEIKAHARSATG